MHRSPLGFSIIAIISLLAFAIVLPSGSQAEVVLFTDEAAFLNAAGSLSFESFESFDGPTSPGTDPIDTPSFIVSITQINGPPDSVMSIIEASGPGGTIPPDGSKFLLAGSSGGQGDLILTFDAFSDPLTTFGLTILDFGDLGTGGNLSIEIEDISFTHTITSTSGGTLGNSNLLFFGIVSDSGSFSEVKLTKTTTGDGIFVDKIHFGLELSSCTDNDGDGYYVEDGCGTEVDCNDDDDTINPGVEWDAYGDGIDDDCDGEIDEDAPFCNVVSVTPDDFFLGFGLMPRFRLVKIVGGGVDFDNEGDIVFSSDDVIVLGSRDISDTEISALIFITPRADTGRFDVSVGDCKGKRVIDMNQWWWN